MKIAVFTSNQPRHRALIASLANIADECHAIVECKTVHPGKIADFYKESAVMQDYFSRVIDAERHVFGDVGYISGVNVMPLRRGDLSLMTRKQLAPALDADIFVVFGSSVIKGWLIDELVARRAVNIHMGMSPYYRGSSCNFWALHDGHPYLVGATVHLLSVGVDSGDILYNVVPSVDGCRDAFDFSMATVRAAHRSVVDRIVSGELARLAPVRQDRTRELRYSRNADFSDAVASRFLADAPDIATISARLDEEQRSSLYPLVAGYREVSDCPAGTVALDRTLG